MVLSVLYLIGLFPFHEFRRMHLNSAHGKFSPLIEHNSIYWKQNQNLPVKVMLQLKPFFFLFYKVRYLHLLSGARVIFLLSTVLQKFLHLWDFVCISLAAILTSRNYLCGLIYCWNGKKNECCDFFFLYAKTSVRRECGIPSAVVRTWATACPQITFKTVCRNHLSMRGLIASRIRDVIHGIQTPQGTIYSQFFPFHTS